MGYTNETTHYGIPLPLGSDKTTPMDYNESMQDVDTVLFESKADSTSALEKANQLQLDLSATNDEITAVKGRVTSLEGTSVTQGQAILQNTQDIADVRADALDMIVAKDEGTAQVATVAVSVGEYFRYNNVLYIATQNIAVGDTIVPNTNCRATNVATELESIDTLNLQTKTDNSLQTTDKTVVGAINELNSELSKHTGDTRIDISANTRDNPYTCPSDGYIYVNNGSGETGSLQFGKSIPDIAIGGFQGSYAVFVRKGTIVVSTVATSSGKYFEPLS